MVDSRSYSAVPHIADVLLVPAAVFRVVPAEREMAEFDHGVGPVHAEHHLFPLVEILLLGEIQVARIFAVVRAGVRNLDRHRFAVLAFHIFLYGDGCGIYGVCSHMNQEFVLVRRNFHIDSDFLFRMQTLVGAGRSDLANHLATAKRAYEKSERLYREFLEQNSRSLHTA